METIKMFEEKHMLSIMKFLYDNGTSSKMQLYNAVSTNPRMPDKLRILEREGLIVTYIDKNMHNTTYAYLTDEGYKIAEHVSAIDKILYEKEERR